MFVSEGYSPNNNLYSEANFPVCQNPICCAASTIVSNFPATIKDQFKTHWIHKDPSQANSGLTSVIDLYNDHREVHPMVVQAFQMKEPFKRMRARHEAWSEKYPNRDQKHGMSYTGISNARPETKALINAPFDTKNVPFDVNGFVKYYEKYPHDPSGGVDKR